MPGVSISTICASSAIATPISRVRVVCALGLTIATFWPTSALTRVDLPALGAPTTATKPQRWVIVFLPLPTAPAAPLPRPFPPPVSMRLRPRPRRACRRSPRPGLEAHGRDQLGRRSGWERGCLYVEILGFAET